MIDFSGYIECPGSSQGHRWTFYCLFSILARSSAFKCVYLFNSKNEYDWMTHDIDGLEILRVLGLPIENELVDHVDAS